MVDDKTKEDGINAESNEQCKHRHLHSTRVILRAQVAAKQVLQECGEYWGREEEQKVTFVCDSKSTIQTLEKKKKRNKENLIHMQLRYI